MKTIDEPTIAELAAWLATMPYQAGVLLYERVIGADFLLTVLKTGPDDYNRRRLTTALRDRQEQLSEAAQEQASRYPDSLKTDLREGKRLMDERVILKEQLRQLADRIPADGAGTVREDMKTRAFRILAIGALLDGIYGKRRFYDQHGYLPEAISPTADMAPADLVKRRNTLRTYVSKQTRDLPTLTDADQHRKATERLARYQSELHQIDETLSALSQNQQS